MTTFGSFGDFGSTDADGDTLPWLTPNISATIMVRLTGGPLAGTEFPTIAGRTSLRIPFSFSDGSIGRVIYTQSALSTSIFTFARLLTPDGLEIEASDIRAIQSAAEADARDRADRAAREAQRAAEQRATEDARRVAAAEAFRTAAENAPAGLLRDVALLHSPNIGLPHQWITCSGCDVNDDYDSDEPLWPCRTATLLAEYLGDTSQTSRSEPT